MFLVPTSRFVEWQRLNRTLNPLRTFLTFAGNRFRAGRALNESLKFEKQQKDARKPVWQNR
jgi:hypothetical protein